MKVNRILSVIIFSFSLLTNCDQLFAQQSKVDSAIYFLKKCKTLNGLDSSSFAAALKVIENTVINDAAIKQIEDVAKTFNKGDDENLSYLIKLYILRSLSKTDVYKAIDYGKSRYSELEKSSTYNFDIIRFEFFREMRIPYRNSDRLKDGFQYYNQKLNECKFTNDSVGIIACYFVLGGFYRTIGLYDQAIYNFKKSISFMDTSHLVSTKWFGLDHPNNMENWLNNVEELGRFYSESGNHNEALKYIYVAYHGVFNNGNIVYKSLSASVSIVLANIKLELNKTDSVESLLKYTIKISESNDAEEYVSALQILAKLKIKTGNLDTAEIILNQCKNIIALNNVHANTTEFVVSPDYYLAEIKLKKQYYKEAIAMLNRDIVWLKNARAFQLRDFLLLIQVYRLTNDRDNTIKTLNAYIALQNIILADEKKYRTMSFEVEQQMNENEASINNLKNENKIEALSKNYSIGIAVLLFLLAGGIYARFRMKSKTAKLLQQKTNQLERAMTELHQSQQQLVQSEKMAAFGSIATRMAHEIQNPLNFVNNFSELSKELVDEVVAAKNEEEKTEAAKVLVENLEKINLHGKRASSIISQLQEHSNKGTAHEFFEESN